MIEDVATEELARLGHDSDDPGILLTLTAGGNDLLDALASGGQLEREARRIERRYSDLVATVREELPEATLVLTTVYDPTDGTGRLPGLDSGKPLPLEYLDRFNDTLRALADEDGLIRVADVHRHFLGHGATASEGERWYWRRNPIEPNARGASEIRRMWLAAVS
jgi:lysophospholipase L1-like esterase